MNGLPQSLVTGRAISGRYRADWDALSHPDDVPLIHQRLSDYLEGRTPVFESEHRMRHTSGRWIWVVGRGKITHSLPDGSGKRISGTMQDITARKQAEQALRESEDRYRKLVEISPDAVILHRDGKIIYVNPAAVRLAGAGSSDELIGKRYPRCGSAGIPRFGPHQYHPGPCRRDHAPDGTPDPAG